MVQSLESDIGKASTRSAGLALILLCIVYLAPDDRMSIKREVGLQKNRFAKIEFFLYQILKKVGTLDQYSRALVDRN